MRAWPFWCPPRQLTLLIWCSSAVYSVMYGMVYSVVYGMHTIHRILWRYARIHSAENWSAMWTHGKQLLHFPSSSVFHAVSSLPITSSPPKALKFTEISNTKISLSAVFKSFVVEA
ncbi:hypothetical protein Y032_0111g218 [Ancylostoma ceylanicum]|uniref:Uncharacterized protein n=1 Tax=Ancylostoma ceylanicum TaxID=53326 RepID=A0A016TEB3_9BILA|nr:hypothetical protein Y032_0111g218 [Ancylostoma ceylanicum]